MPVLTCGGLALALAPWPLADWPVSGPLAALRRLPWRPGPAGSWRPLARVLAPLRSDSARRVAGRPDSGALRGLALAF